MPVLNSQEPVDGDNERDVFCGQSDRVQYHHHGHQARLRDAGRADTGRRRRDAATQTQQALPGNCIRDTGTLTPTSYLVVGIYM